MILLTGCGGGNTVAPPVTSTGQYQSLQFTLTTGSSYARGQQVPLTFTVKNTGTQAVTIGIGPAPDFTISRGSQLVYQESQKFGTIGGVALRSLAPGEAVSSSLTWSGKDLQDQVVPPGQYTLKAWARLSNVDDATFYTPGEAEANLAAAPLDFTIR